MTKAPRRKCFVISEWLKSFVLHLGRQQSIQLPQTWGCGLTLVCNRSANSWFVSRSPQWSLYYSMRTAWRRKRRTGEFRPHKFLSTTSYRVRIFRFGAVSGVLFFLCMPHCWQSSDEETKTRRHDTSGNLTWRMDINSSELWKVVEFLSNLTGHCWR